MFERRERSAKQNEFWVQADHLPAATPSAFYRRVEATLLKMEFARQVWAICGPAYADPARGGRPGIDPVVDRKMLMVGFFENLPSDRALAARCEDSLSARGCLGYGLEEATPEHSSLRVLRDRLSLDQREGIHRVLLAALRAQGLLRGRKLGLESSVLQANASLRALEHRNPEQSYGEYVKGLAAEAGIAPADTKAVRRFDKKREGRRTSNAAWANPHDPDAKVGRTKDGACAMTYKPEQTVDLESGVLLRAEVRPGDAADNDASLCERVRQSVAVLSAVAPAVPLEKLGAELCGDEGYFALAPIAELQACGVRTVNLRPAVRAAQPGARAGGTPQRLAPRRPRDAEQKRQGPAEKTRRTFGTRFCPRARLRRAAAHDAARVRETHPEHAHLTKRIVGTQRRHLRVAAIRVDDHLDLAMHDDEHRAALAALPDHFFPAAKPRTISTDGKVRMPSPCQTCGCSTAWSTRSGT